jgi:hypothetical protein
MKSIVLAVAFAGAAAACGADQGARRTDTATAMSTTPPATPAISAGTVTVPGSVPAGIDAIGHHGENAYDLVKAGNWAGARASVDSIRPMLDSIPGSATITFRELNQAVVNKDQRAALVASNHLTKLGALLSEPYHPTVPADVMLLDYDGRELEIWAAAGDRVRLRETASAMRRTWNAVRPRVEARGGATEAARFEGLVRRVEAATAPTDYARLATPILDAVDTLEQVFTR